MRNFRILEKPYRVLSERGVFPIGVVKIDNIMYIPINDTIESPKEREVNQKLLEVMDTIIHDWGLNCNHGELTHAIHTIQLFIIKHGLQSAGDTTYASKWYGKEENG